MSLLTKDQILSADDIKTQEVEVPEWGGSVNVRGMTAIQRDNFELSHMNGKLKNYRATVAARTICDENGVPLFSELEILKLAQKSSVALSRVYDIAMKLCGITSEDAEELEKL